jgi:hypothetical protein
MSTDQSSHFLRVIKKPEVLSSIVLIVAFSLPWFVNPVLTAAGYNIARLLHFINVFQSIAGMITLLVYLIPIGAAVIIILSLFNKSTGPAAMLVGSVPVIIIIVLFFRCRYILYQCRIGILLTLAASLVLLIAGATNELSRAKKMERDRNT